MAVSNLSGERCQPSAPWQQTKQEGGQGGTSGTGSHTENFLGGVGRWEPRTGQRPARVTWPKPALQAQACPGAPALGGVQVRLYLAWPFPLAGCSCPGWGRLGMLRHSHWLVARRCWAGHLHNHAWSPPPGLPSHPLTSHQEKAEGLRAGADSEPH